MSLPLQRLRQQYRVTTKGRIVYDRPVHHFSQNDVKRIVRGYFTYVPVFENVVLQACYAITEYMLRIILDLFGAGMFTTLVLNWLVSIANWVLGEIGAYMGEATQRRVANQVVASLAPYSNYEITWIA